MCKGVYITRTCYHDDQNWSSLQQNDNIAPGAVTVGNLSLAFTREVNLRHIKVSPHYTQCKIKIRCLCDKKSKKMFVIAQKLYCECMLELHYGGSSNEYSQHRV